MTLKERLKQFDLLSQAETVENSVLSPELAALCNDLSRVLSEKIAFIPVWFDYSEEEQKQLIQSFLNCKLNEEFSEIRLTDAEKNRVFAVFLKSVRGFGSLDFLIAQDNVSSIIVNSSESVLVKQAGVILNSEVVFDKKQYEELNKKLWKLSCAKNFNITKFRYSNLIITLIAGTISPSKIIIEKISDKKYYFEDLVNLQVVNSESKNFISSLIKAKKRILLVVPNGFNKSFLLNAFVNEIDKNDRVALFENLNVLNLDSILVDRFSVRGLKQFELSELFEAISLCMPDYVVSDVWDFDFDKVLIENFSKKSSAYILITNNKRYQDEEVYYNNLFDYILKFKNSTSEIQLDFIGEIYTNDSGEQEIKEIFKFNNETYEYELLRSQNIPNISNPTPVEDQPKSNKVSFRARFE